METVNLGNLKLRQLKKMRLVYRKKRYSDIADILDIDTDSRRAIQKAIRLKQINYYEKQEVAFESQVFKFLNKLHNKMNPRNY